MATVLLHPDVEKQSQSLLNDIEDCIQSKLEEAGVNPDRHLNPLKGRPEYLFRIGKCRAIVDWVEDQNELRVIDIDTRDIVYQ